MVKILFIHGAFGTPLAFRQIISDLKLKKSEYETFHYTVDEPLEEIVGRLTIELDVMNCDVILVGHSLGGIISVANIEHRNVIGAITIATPFGGSNIAMMMSPLINHEMLRSISTINPILLGLNSIETKKPVFNIITTEGNNPLVTGENDAVVTIKSQSALRWSEKYTIKHNHNEVLLSRETSRLLDKLIKQIA